MYNFFKSLLFCFLCQGIIVEFDYYFIGFNTEKKTRFFASHHCRSNLQCRKSYCCCLLFFYKYKLVVYAILLLKLLFCKKFYIFEFLSYLHWHWTIMHCFYIFNPAIYDLFYLLNEYFIASFNLFLHKFQIFYYKNSILYDVCILSIHKEHVYCHSYLTYAYEKLDLISVFAFIQLIRYSILVI